MRKVDVAIIGAGTAGLSARREVSKVTDNYVVIDDGPLGTTCARVGCMPSKALIEVSNSFHHIKKTQDAGISNTEGLGVDRTKVMEHVRKLRDRFVKGVKTGIEPWQQTHLIRKRAKFISQNQLDLGDEKIEAKSIIVATGSTPIVPGPWKTFGPDRVMTTDDFFEQESIPENVAVIGLGVIGIELGQALARLGVNVHGITVGKAIGGLSDPELQDYVLKSMQKEFPINISGVESLSDSKGKIAIQTKDGQEITVDRIYCAVGRSPNVRGMGLENLGVKLSDKGMPSFSNTTYRIEDSNIFLVGDVNAERPILHEAADEGRIAGYNAGKILQGKDTQCFQRRTKLGITFSDPQIATLGKTYQELRDSGEDFIVGEVSYEGQGRAITKLKECGLLKIYANPKSGLILGSELFAPNGDHLSHLLAWVVESKLTVQELLKMPFYHPVLEEGVRTALRNAFKQVETFEETFEYLRCEDPPVGSRCDK